MTTQRPAEQTGRLREQAAEEIRALLARRKMSAAKLATRMGVGQTYLSRRMTGEVPLDLDDLEIIARELNVTVAELLGTGVKDTVANLALSDREAPIADHPSVNPSKVLAAASRMIPTMRRPARIESSPSQPFGAFERVS
jgi:transcriptional regulator with XRE-family HTH domain